jgi:hypothetical protein
MVRRLKVRIAPGAAVHTRLVEVEEEVAHASQKEAEEGSIPEVVGEAAVR